MDIFVLSYQHAFEDTDVLATFSNLQKALDFSVKNYKVTWPDDIDMKFGFVGTSVGDGDTLGIERFTLDTP